MHTILFGDTIEKMRELPSKSIDMICADLPYKHTKAKWDKPINLCLMWCEYKRVCKPNAAILLFGYGKFSAELINSNLQWYRYSMIWLKTNPTNHLNANRQPLRLHEDIHVFYAKQPTYNPQKTSGHLRKISSVSHKRNCKETELYNSHNKTGYDSTERFPTTVLKYPSDKQKNNQHSTQKPVALLENLVLTFSNEGNTILDNTAGSGSLGEAAERTGRNSILIDNDEQSIEKMITRLSKFKAT